MKILDTFRQESVRFLIWTVVILMVVIAVFYGLVISPAESFFSEEVSVDSLGNYGELVGALLGVAVGFAGAWVAIKIAQSSLETTKEQQRGEERAFVREWAREIQLRVSDIETDLLKLHALTCALWDEFKDHHGFAIAEDPDLDLKVKILTPYVASRLKKSYSVSLHSEIMATLESLSNSFRIALSDKVIRNAMLRSLEGIQSHKDIDRYKTYTFAESLLSGCGRDVEKIEQRQNSLPDYINEFVDSMLTRRWRLSVSDSSLEETKLGELIKYFIELQALADADGETQANWATCLLMGYFSHTKELKELNGSQVIDIAGIHRKVSNRLGNGAEEIGPMYYNSGFFGLLILFFIFPAKEALEAAFMEQYLKDDGNSQFRNDVKKIAERELGERPVQLIKLVGYFERIADDYIDCLKTVGNALSINEKARVKIASFDLDDPFATTGDRSIYDINMGEKTSRWEGADSESRGLINNEVSQATVRDYK